MAQYALNFADAPDFDLIPEGKYPAIVDEVTLEPNSAADGHNLVWNWSVEVDGVQRKIRMWTSLKPNGLWRVKGVFKSLGVLEKDQTEVNIEVDEETNLVLQPELAGIPAVVQIVHAPYQGEKRSNIGNVYPAGTEALGASSLSGTGAKAKSKARLV